MIAVDHGITNLNGEVSFTTNISENSSFYCLYYGTGDYNPCMSNTVNIEKMDYIYAPLLDGSETLYNLNTPRNVTISNGEYVGYNQYIKGWSNATDWKLECDILFEQRDGSGLIICLDNATRYDSTEIEIGQNQFFAVKTNNIPKISQTIHEFSLNVYHHIKLQKTGTTLSLTTEYGTYTGTWNDLATISGFGIGGYSWSSHKVHLKNIIVEEV